MLSEANTAALRRAFEEADYTVDGVVGLIGESAHRALGRNNTTAAVLAVEGRSDPLAVMTALWPLQQVVSHDHLRRAMPDLIGPLLVAGLLVSDGVRVRALVDIRPYASDEGHLGWIVSDLSPGLDGEMSPIRSDFVLGVSPASTTLAQMTVRHPVQRALDLGTGCGVQSLHLAKHAEEVVATDLNLRALDLARLTTALSGTKVDFRHGSLYEPVQDERFDLIITNPPYVMTPPRESGRLTYRDAGFKGDDLVKSVVCEGAMRLNDGGTLQVLGNWAHVRGQDWTDRLAEWVLPTGCDAMIIQREVLEPLEYIELWLADAGLLNSPRYVTEYCEWVAYFEQLGIEGIGMGWINLHRPGRDESPGDDPQRELAPQINIEHWPHPVEQPIGPAFAAQQAGVELNLRLDDQAVLAATWVLADDIQEESLGTPGEADPHHIVLRQQRGFRRAVEVDTALAGILGTCDGELPLNLIIHGVATILEVDEEELTAEILPKIREFARNSMLALKD